MSNTILDASIPVLTEVIDATAPSPIASVSPIKPVSVGVSSPAISPPVSTPVLLDEPPELNDIVDVPIIDGWLNEEWNRLERKIGGRILTQVMERLEADIEARVRDALADVLQVAVQTLADDIKENLQTTLHTVITKAVKEEISHMQNSKD